MRKRFSTVLMLMLFAGVPAFSDVIDSLPNNNNAVRWSIRYSSGLFTFSRVLQGEKKITVTRKKDPVEYRGTTVTVAIGHLFAQTQINIGYEGKQQRLSSFDLPHIKENMNVLEFDAQLMLPLPISWSFVLYPFVGYSYLDYFFDEWYRRYHSLVFGCENEIRPFRWYKMNLFIRFSPITQDAMSAASSRQIMTLAYGAGTEFIVGPLRLLLNISSRHSFESEEIGADVYDMHVMKYSVSMKIQL